MKLVLFVATIIFGLSSYAHSYQCVDETTVSPEIAFEQIDYSKADFAVEFNSAKMLLKPLSKSFANSFDDFSRNRENQIVLTSDDINESDHGKQAYLLYQSWSVIIENDLYLELTLVNFSENSEEAESFNEKIFICH